MKMTKNTRLIVIIGYCFLLILAISGFIAIYLEMAKSSDMLKKMDPQEKLIELSNTLNNLYLAEGTAVIITGVDNEHLYFEYDSLMNCAFVQIDSMKSIEDNPQILSDLDSLTTLLEKKLNNLQEMIYLMNQIENNTVREITNTMVSTFGDTGKLNDLLVNKTQNIQDTSKIITGKKGILKRISNVFKPDPVDTLTHIKKSSSSRHDELATPYVSDTLVSYIKKTSWAAEKKNAKIIRTLVDRQNEFHLINGQTSTKIDQIVSKIKITEYQNSLDALNERNKSLVKSFGLVILVGFLAFIVAVFFVSWTLKSINVGIELQKKIQDAKKSVDKLLISREQLIYTITHDIKAPISSIIGFLDLLSGEKISRKQQYFVKNMYLSATHIIDLVKNLLDFQSLEKNQQEASALAFSPYVLVNDIYVSFLPLAQKKKLIFKFSSMIREDKKYTGDPYRIKQILNNLISNAIKFTPENGLISIRASIEKGDVFRVSVKDSGPGVSEKDKNRIFEEFIRLEETKETVEGTGLGLTISKKLSSLLNGNIEIRSQKGQGANFVLTVPLISGLNESAVTPDDKTIHILFVDDDAVQLNLLSELMKRAGLSYVCSMSSLDALKLLEKEVFDIIFTDIQMPDIKGFELVKRIRESSYPQAKTIPVIGLSGDSRWMEDNPEQGFTDFLSKPFSEEDILRIIEKYTKKTVNFAETFDLSNLENLLEYASYDCEAALNMVDSFVNETNSNLKLLGNALDKKDSETVKQISHKMGSLMKMLSAPEIVEILNLFEKGEQSEKKQVILAGLIAKKIREIKALRKKLNDRMLAPPSPLKGELGQQV
ncbi:MAG: response regulator [Dysgonamonadaceae bacterium]|jgi:signal transduction histidine kinase/CheY-like chemotaxis protein|nr:response regulator [Dysgonamonadaceae bacterium]